MILRDEVERSGVVSVEVERAVVDFDLVEVDLSDSLPFPLFEERGDRERYGEGV